MSIAKIIQIVACSEKSFDDAIKQGVAKAAETIHGISGVKVQDMTATVRDNKLAKYKVTLDIAFGVDE